MILLDRPHENASLRPTDRDKQQISTHATVSLYLITTNTMLKKILIFLYILMVAVLGCATFIEKAQGTEYIHEHYYGTWWFSALWAILTATSIAWIVKQEMRRWPLILLHASFIIILFGALLTHLTSKQGFIHLRIGETTGTYYATNNIREFEEKELPFKVGLQKFVITYHDGTEAIADYESFIIITNAGYTSREIVSMNKILSYKGFRFYQNSYDEDM